MADSECYWPRCLAVWGRGCRISFGVGEEKDVVLRGRDRRNSKGERYDMFLYLYGEVDGLWEM